MSKYIDKIFYINLERRTDRRAEIEQELNNFQLNYERFNAIEHIHGIVGCGYSHLAVLKIAKERNYKNVLIFEDDFTFLVSKQKFEDSLTIFFESNIPFDVCMLSYNLQQFQILYDNPIVNKITESLTASGYIVNQHYLQKLIDLYDYAIPLLEKTGEHWIYANDQIWKDYQKTDNWFYFKTRIGKQRPSYTDNGYNPIENKVFAHNYKGV
jgi:GR25 family glycosyltransferase involved in LPS biosynthesis